MAFHGLRLAGVHILNVLGQQLAIEADRADGQSDEPSERAKAKQLHREDRQNNFRERAGPGNDSPATHIDPARGEIARSAKADGD